MKYLVRIADLYNCEIEHITIIIYLVGKSCWHRGVFEYLLPV